MRLIKDILAAIALLIIGFVVGASIEKQEKCIELPKIPFSEKLLTNKVAE